ncbi:MAG: methylmalonyl-CoA mutase [Bdellovibrionales bacterium]|nr:methylmalonyl-CoA mutase [Bdellovibrionales bacterium]
MGKTKDKPMDLLKSSGIDNKGCYSEADVEADLKKRLGQPGSYPYTRGVYRDMYRGRPWTMRQYAGFGTAAEANQRYHYLLSQGTTGLSVAFDLPTQMGLDSDHPLAKGEVGKVGVSINDLSDMRDLFTGIPLESVSVSMTINATAAILLAQYLVLAEEQGIGWDKLRGTIQNDILKEYIARGTYIYPPKQALRLVTDIFGFCARQVPNWNTISISGYHIREAGSTAIQEVAFTLADAITYVEAALQAGLKVDDFAPRIAFFFNCHSNFFEEIAKFRAARRMWAKIMRERFGAEDPKSMMLRFHTQTAGSSLTAQQPLNNIIRTTTQALAAVLGGTQSLHTNSYDEALSLPSAQAVQLALRTQQILAHESGITETVDPLAGSYLVENWTDQIERQAWLILDQIQSLGGMLSAIEQGYPQGEIERSAFRWQREVESQDRIIVGVNSFLDGDSPPSETAINYGQREAQQCEELQGRRRERDPRALSESLTQLEIASKGNENLMPLIINCVRNGATLGEISTSLRKEFGEYRGHP